MARISKAAREAIARAWDFGPPNRKRPPPRKTCPSCMRLMVDEIGADLCHDCTIALKSDIQWESEERKRRGLPPI